MGQLPELDRFYPTALQQGSSKTINHFFPVGGQGRMLGFSLLGRDQEDPAWETPFTALHASQEFLRVGPFGERLHQGSQVAGDWWDRKGACRVRVGKSEPRKC